MILAEPHPPTPRRLALNFLDILVLAGFAVAQPLFALLARSAGFFVVHRSTPADLLLLVFCVYAIPTALLMTLELLVAPSRRATAIVHVAILTLLFALDLLPLVKRAALPAAVSLSLALLAGALCAIGYSRIRTWRWSLVWLSPALLVFPILLLFFSPVSGILLPGHPPNSLPGRIGHPAPIVVVVFDEFPLSSLLDHAGNIDAALYPNFAALARAGAWYRNATAVGESTLLSLPSLVSGLYPDPRRPRLPDAAGHPNTLFTALGGVYRLNVNENNTRLCPERLCADPAPAGPRLRDLLRDSSVLWLYTVLPSALTGPLPDITQSWKDFRSPDRLTLDMWRQFDDLTDWHDRVQQFREFTDSVRPSSWPALHFLHILLPHAPWEYLPSGQKFALPESRIRGLAGVNDRGEDPNRWTADSWAVAQAYQRHLVQVRLVDRLVGELIAHLRDTGLYDPALLIVTADHGASFRPGDSRRSVTSANYPDILSVPLFIKYPRQREGGLDDRPAELVDVLPTVLDVLKLQPAWKPDGRSLLGAAPQRPAKIVVTDDERRLEFPAGLAALFESVHRKIALFGGDGRYDIYRLGDRYGWIGRPLPPALPTEPGVRYQLDRQGYYHNVDPGAPILLTNLTGRLFRSGPAAATPLAVAVNGAVCAVTETYRDGDAERFSALLPEASLRPGRNRIDILRVDGATGLRAVPRVDARPYEWGATVKFGAGGSAAAFYGIGWGRPEQDITWTDGHLATLYLSVHPPAAGVSMTVRLSAFTRPGKLERQRVRVLVDQREVAQWSAQSGFADYTARIPREPFADAAAEIAFELPDAASPIALGAGTDSRTLGVALLELRLTPE